MTVDEIKERHSMREIVERYGLQINRNGFCNCCFHKGDNTASMKIYEKSYHCFGCGNSGDVFTFVQQMEHCDFKTAFYMLGGKYEEKPTRARAVQRAKFERERIERQRKERERAKAKKYISDTITLMQYIFEIFEPMDDMWCLAKNFEPVIMNDWTELFITEERGDDFSNVLRRCKQFRLDIIAL